MTAKSGALKTLSLAKTLDLNEATALHGKLLALKGNDIAIDASGVERAGALSIQVLMSAAKTWEEDKLGFTFSKVSDALATTMQLIGVNHDHLLAKESSK